MIQDPLLDSCCGADSLSLERAGFNKRRLNWKEEARTLVARLSWDEDGRLTSREEKNRTFLYAYDENGRETACYVLDSENNVISRELREWNDVDQLICRRLKEGDREKTWTYEHDTTGRITAERRGSRVRVEKRDADGLLKQEYLYDGETPDLVTDFSYDKEGRLLSRIVKDPDGRTHQEEYRCYDENGFLSALKVENSDGRILRDETYAYGALLGRRWLERVTWIPDGGKKGRRRPLEVIYRSFTLAKIQDETPGPSASAASPAGKSEQPGKTAEEFRTIAFANGIYTGPVTDGHPEGNGVFHYNDESIYRGMFEDGVMSGPGELIWPDGRRMEGSFTGGLLNGRGTCAWADGSRYEGEFLNGRMHGAGVFTWADGTCFQGLFEKGERTNQGAWEKTRPKENR